VKNQGDSEANSLPWSFPLMGQEESQTLIGYSGRGTHATSYSVQSLKLSLHTDGA